MNLYKLSNYHYINPSKRAYDNFTVRFYRDKPSCSILSLLSRPSQKRVASSSRWKVWRQWRMSLSLATEIEVGFKFLEGFCTGPISLLPPVTIRHLSLSLSDPHLTWRRTKKEKEDQFDQCWSMLVTVVSTFWDKGSAKESGELGNWLLDETLIDWFVAHWTDLSWRRCIWLVLTRAPRVPVASTDIYRPTTCLCGTKPHEDHGCDDDDGKERTCFSSSF